MAQVNDQPAAGYLPPIVQHEDAGSPEEQPLKHWRAWDILLNIGSALPGVFISNITIGCVMSAAHAQGLNVQICPREYASKRANKRTKK